MRERLPQGHVRLLETDLAQRLLQAPIPARMAFVWTDGTPRIVPSWFHWTGEEIVMVTYLAGPATGIRHPAARIAVLRTSPRVAVTIDTESSPPQSLSVRGTAGKVTEVEGVAPEYAAAARRYLGDGSAAQMLAGQSVSLGPGKPASVYARTGSACWTSKPACPACRAACDAADGDWRNRDDERICRAGGLRRRIHRSSCRAAGRGYPVLFDELPASVSLTQLKVVAARRHPPALRRRYVIRPPTLGSRASGVVPRPR